MKFELLPEDHKITKEEITPKKKLIPYSLDESRKKNIKEEPEKEVGYVPALPPKLTELVKELPHHAAKTLSVPLTKAATRVGGLTGDLIELPGELTKSLYSLLGRQPPEWTEGPVGWRLNKEGNPRFGLQTTEELRENNLFGNWENPENALQQNLGDTADLAAQLATSGVTGVRNLARMTGAITAVKKGAELIGLPQGVTSALEALTGLTIGSRTNVPNSRNLASQEGQRLTDIAQREGVAHAPAGIQEAGRAGTARFLRRWGTAGEVVRERANQFAHEIEQAYHSVLGDIYEPYQTNRNLRQLRTEAGQLFEPLRPMAKTRPNKLDLTDFNTILDEELANLRKNTKLSEKELEIEASLQNMKYRIRQNGGLNLEEAVDTFRGFNDTIDWENFGKTEFKERNIKEQLRKDIHEGGEGIPNFNETFDMTNQAYTELANLRSAAEVMQPVFQGGEFNLTQFSRTIRDPVNSELIRRALGAENFHRLQEISDLAHEGRRNFEAVGALLPESGQQINNTLGMATRLIRPTPGAFALIGAAAFGRNFAARILTSPNLQANYLGYMRALRDTSPRLAMYYLRKINGEVAEKKQKKQKFELLPE